MRKYPGQCKAGAYPLIVCQREEAKVRRSRSQQGLHGYDVGVLLSWNVNHSMWSLADLIIPFPGGIPARAA